MSSMNFNTGASSRSTSRSRVPMNKIVVGQAPGPNVKNVRSKIGSLNNVQHKAAGGDKKIESQKLQWNTGSRVGSFQNANHRPQGGQVKVLTQKLEWNVKSKVGSFENVKHTPGGGNVKIFDETKSTTSGRSSNTSTENLVQRQCDEHDLRQLTENKLKL